MNTVANTKIFPKNKLYLALGKILKFKNKIEENFKNESIFIFNKELYSKRLKSKFNVSTIPKDLNFSPKNYRNFEKDNLVFGKFKFVRRVIFL